MKKRTIKAPVDVVAATTLAIDHPVNALHVGEHPSVTTIDLAPIHAAAERAGLRATSIVVGARLSVQCGPHVPTFPGATVAEVVALIAAYQCKYCGTGGGHTPNCGRPR